VSNVLMYNRNTDRYLEIVRDADPDIVCVLEPNKWWEERLRVLEKDYPYTTKHPLENTYGILLYSRLKLVSSEVNFLIEENIPSTHSTVGLRSGDLIELYCIHPEPPVPAQDPTSIERDAELILVGKKARKSQKPTVVIGDFNDVAWSHTTSLFQKISGLLDPRIGRGFYNTFHSKVPIVGRFPVDHVFHSPSFKLVELKRLPDFCSDHFAIFIELSYEPEERHKQALPSPNPEKKKEAEKEIEKAK
jgi:endonuclease/exonuclease/phosphatase (EEP) superfamily protein YafD